MRTLRAIFLGLQFREKLLLVAFALLLGAIWGANFNRRAWQFKRAAAATTFDLKTQQQWLDNEAAIEAGVKKTAARLDPVRTLDAGALLATISSFAGEAGLTIKSSGEPREETNGQFNVHTRGFIIEKAEYAPLLKFYRLLEARSPYIGIEQFTLQPTGPSSPLSNVSLTVSAPEVVR